MLLNADADPTLKNNAGQTPYNIAQQRNHREIGRALRNYKSTKDILRQASGNHRKKKKKN
jgi:ankyrin repeat protein